MKIVLAAGMMRSGSTWQYNVIRLALAEAGCKVYGCWIGDYDPKNAEGMDYVVMKTHAFHKKWAARADMIFTTIRVAKEIRASFERIGSDQNEKAIKKIFKSHAAWMAISDHITEYSNIDKLAPIEIGRIISSLGLEGRVCKDVVMDAMNIQQPDQGTFGAYDPVTLLHPNHISVATN